MTDEQIRAEANFRALRRLRSAVKDLLDARDAMVAGSTEPVQSLDVHLRDLREAMVDTEPVDPGRP